MRIGLVLGVFWLAACAGEGGAPEDAAGEAEPRAAGSAPEGAPSGADAPGEPARGAADAASERADPAEQALMPLPEAFRADARVLRLGDGRVVETLRDGAGAFVCLTDDPRREGFHVACYHRSLEPYMARGRALEAEGITGGESLERRWGEIEAGELPLPDHPAALYSLTGEGPPAPGGAGAESVRRLTVLYVPYADADSLGLPTRPEVAGPWLMFPGKPTAHVMIGG